jgi:hypothetical protein
MDRLVIIALMVFRPVRMKLQSYVPRAEVLVANNMKYNTSY